MQELNSQSAVNSPRKSQPLLAAILVGHLVLLGWFSSFTAEDSFIVFRYSENLVDGNGLVFNEGQPVTALTSPLHAIVAAALYAITGTSLWSHKICSVLIHLLAVTTAVRILDIRKQLWPIAWLFILWSPYVVFWTVGGLETMYLSSAVVLSFALSHSITQQKSTSHIIWFSILLAVAFLGRYDSVLITVPLWFHVAASIISQNKRSSKKWLGDIYRLLFPGLLIALTWLAISQWYFHDIIPTSKYHKPTHGEEQWAAILYMGQFMIATGLLPVILWILIDRTGKWGNACTSMASIAKEHLGVMTGLVIFFGYCTYTVMSHMMFSYRMLLPYLPVGALLVTRWIERTIPDTNSDDQSTLGSGRFGAKSISILMVFMVIGQLAQAIVIDRISINPGKVGEYRRLSRIDYTKFMQLLSDQADEIKHHWEQHGDQNRKPRIFVYAAGIVPYKLRDFHVLDWGLVSYRKNVKVFSIQRGLLYSSDYIMTLTPRHHSLKYQLQRNPDDLEVVTETTMPFDGTQQTFATHFNRNPIQYRLPDYIDGLPVDEIPEKIED